MVTHRAAKYVEVHISRNQQVTGSSRERYVSSNHASLESGWDSTFFQWLVVIRDEKTKQGFLQGPTQKVRWCKLLSTVVFEPTTMPLMILVTHLVSSKFANRGLQPVPRHPQRVVCACFGQKHELELFDQVSRLLLNFSQHSWAKRWLGSLGTCPRNINFSPASA